MKLTICTVADIAYNVLREVDEYEQALVKLLDLVEFNSQEVKKRVNESESRPIKILYEKMESLREELFIIIEPEVEVDDKIFKKYIDKEIGTDK